MADLSDVQSAQAVKIVGSDLTGTETNPVAANASGELSTTVNNITGTIVLPTGAATEATQTAQSVLYGAITETAPVSDISSSGLNGRLQRIAQRITSLIAIFNPLAATPALNTSGLVVRPLPYEPESFSAASTAFVPPAAATDIFTITGSATKTIRIHKIRASGTTTSGSAIKVTFVLLKRSSANTGGTRVAATVIKHDTLNAAGTATVGHYTANPTLGTLVGNIKAVSTAVAANGIAGGEVVWDFESDGNQPLVLRGIAEQASVNLNAATVTGPVFSVTVEWSEV